MNTDTTPIFDLFTSVPKDVYLNSDGTLNWMVVNTLLTAPSSKELLKPMFQIKNISNEHFVKPWFLAHSIKAQEDPECCARELISWMNLENEKYTDSSIWVDNPEVIAFFQKGMQHLFEAIQNNPIYEQKLVQKTLCILDEKKLGKTSTTHYLPLYFLFPNAIETINASSIGENLRNSARCSWINHPHYDVSKNNKSPTYSKGKAFSVNAVLSNSTIVKSIEKNFGYHQLLAWFEDFQHVGNSVNHKKLAYWLKDTNDSTIEKYNKIILRKAMYDGIESTINYVNTLPEKMRNDMIALMMDIFNEEHAIKPYPREDTPYAAYWHTILIGFLPFEAAMEKMSNLRIPRNDELENRSHTFMRGTSSPENETKWRIWWTKQKIENAINGEGIDNDYFHDIIVNDPVYWSKNTDSLLNAVIKHNLYSPTFLPFTIILPNNRTNNSIDHSNIIVERIKETAWMDQILVHFALMQNSMQDSSSEYWKKDRMLVSNIFSKLYPIPEAYKLQQAIILKLSSTECNKALEKFYAAIHKTYIFQNTKAFDIMHRITEAEMENDVEYIKKGLSFFNSERAAKKAQALDIDFTM